MIDEKDIKILTYLKKDGRLSAQEISKRAGIPTTTVFNRIKRMEKTGVIKGYTVITDDGRTGRRISAYILITVTYLSRKKEMSQSRLAAALRRHELVEEVAIVTGATDIIVKIRVSDMKELNDFVTSYLRNIEGIERTQTSVVLENF